MDLLKFPSPCEELGFHHVIPLIIQVIAKNASSTLRELAIWVPRLAVHQHGYPLYTDFVESFPTTFLKKPNTPLLVGVAMTWEFGGTAEAIGNELARLNGFKRSMDKVGQVLLTEGSIVGCSCDVEDGEGLHATGVAYY